jgi:transcription antitermination protein NusB
VGKRRHLSRQMALQVLYAHRFSPEEPGAIALRMVETGEVSKKNWTTFSRELVAQTIERAAEADQTLEKALKNWRLERLSTVDLLLLRMAFCELTVFTDIPPRVTLNEYIELAKEFGTDDSASFINGILDRLAKELGEIQGTQAEAEDEAQDKAEETDSPPQA